MDGILPLLAVPAAMFLLILQQPNLSTAGSIMIVAVLMMLLAGARWKHLSLMGIAGLAVGFAYAWVEPYRRERLLSFRNPFAQMSDEGYQLSQSLSPSAPAACLAGDWDRGGRSFPTCLIRKATLFSPLLARISACSAAAWSSCFLVAFAIAGMRIALNCQDRYGCLLAAGLRP